MKRVIIFVFSLLCITISSCKKSEPQNLLIGDWEVSISVQFDVGISGGPVKPADGGTWYYTFGENGRGRMADVTDATRRFNFTYEYDNLFNAVLLRRENASKDNVLEIEVLTKESFVFRESDIATFGGIAKGTATYNGKRIK